MKKLLFLLLFCICQHFLYQLAGQDIHQKHDKSKLLEDFTQFRKILEKHHAGLYVFLDKGKFQARLDSIEQNIDTMSELEFYKIIRKIMVSTREKHGEVGVLAGDKSSNIAKVFKEQKVKSVPLVMAFRPKDKAYIYANASPDSTILEGSELISINGKSIQKINKQIFPYIVTDGYIKISKYDQMNSFFRYYYYLFVSQTEDFEVTYKTENETQSIQLKGLNIDSMNTWIEERYPEIVESRKKKNLYSLEYKKAYETAIFTLHSFAGRRFTKDGLRPKSLFRAVFDTIQNQYQAKNIVIDLRRNRGGRISYMFDLLSYLTSNKNKPLVYESKKRGKKKWRKTRLKKVKENNFQGNIYILVGPRTFSAGVMLAVFAKEFANAQIVGLETGGRYDGTTAGSSKFFTLKNTRIRVRVPIYLYKYNIQKQKKGRGVMPDYRVPTSLKSIKTEDDPDLDKILEWIKQK